MISTFTGKNLSSEQVAQVLDTSESTITRISIKKNCYKLSSIQPIECYKIITAVS